ncbi:MAG: hypothetical protein HOW73_44290 [Polyangiaceae bacterium]|nr:hypothetical protein [Polyangiaceae bacterium]
MRPTALSALVAVTATAASVFAHEGFHAEIAALDARLEVAPDDVVTLVERAALHRRAGHEMEAYVDAENAVLVAPDDPRALLERGIALHALGAAASAEEDIDVYLTTGGTDVEALVVKARLARERGDDVVARSTLSDAIARAARPDLVIERGLIDESRGALDDAAAGYEEGLELLGGAHVVRKRLVRVAAARGDFDRAEQLIVEAMTRASFDAEWLLERADVRAARGRMREALEDREAALAEIDASLATRPTDLRHLLRARALLALGRIDEARRTAEGVVARSPGLVEAHTLLRTMKSSSDRDRWSLEP